MFRLASLKLYFIPIWAWQIMPIVIAGVLTTSVASAALLQQRSLEIANDTPSANTSYITSFSLSNNETLGSIEIQFCFNSPLSGYPCSVPTGINVANAVLASQSGISGFSVSSTSNANTIILSRVPSVALAGPLSFTFSNVINPSYAGAFYGRLQTYATANASGTVLDNGGLALVLNNGYSITTTVPPYLLFCVGVSIANYNCAQANGNYINFGYLTPSLTSAAQSQLLVATNAQSGYTIQLSGSTLTSGNNIVPPLDSGGFSQPGQDQFGLNLVANSDPVVGLNAQGPGTGGPVGGYSSPNSFEFNNGSVIASSTNASDLKEYTISYIINISRDQPPGVYATTLTYIGIGNF